MVDNFNHSQKVQNCPKSPKFKFGVFGTWSNGPLSRKKIGNQKNPFSGLPSVYSIFLESDELQGEAGGRSVNGKDSFDNNHQHVHLQIPTTCASLYTYIPQIGYLSRLTDYGDAISSGHESKDCPNYGHGNDKVFLCDINPFLTGVYNFLRPVINYSRCR